MPLGIGKKKSKDFKSDRPKGKSKYDDDVPHPVDQYSEKVASLPNTDDPATESPKHEHSNGKSTENGEMSSNDNSSQPPIRPKLVFQCQQAQGSPVGIISGFTNVKELYQKIAECYGMQVSDILYCTLNTHKIDMSRLLGGQIGLEDFIFAHIKGQPKETEVTKTDDALGLTITDNGNGYAFIKRIKEGSIMDKAELIDVGDHLEKLDGKLLVGCRHFEVAKMLKEIPKGQMFTIRLIEPLKSGFSHIGPQRSRGSKNTTINSGMKTLRLPKKGNSAKVEMADEIVDIAVEKINGLLESYMGINDNELARSIWDIGSVLDNTQVLAEKIDESDLSEFGFSDEFIFELWGKITDAKQGRLNNVAEFSENF